MRLSVSVDLDSTLCDTRHRWHMLDDVDVESRDYEAYSMACSGDSVVPGVAALIRALWDKGFQIHLVSARSSSATRLTVKWLRTNNIPYNSLLLMDPTDPRDHVTYKVQTIQRIPSLAFHVDDHPDVEIALEEAGIPCLLVHPPRLRPGV